LTKGSPGQWTREGECRKTEQKPGANAQPTESKINQTDLPRKPHGLKNWERQEGIRVSKKQKSPSPLTGRCGEVPRETIEGAA